MVYSREMDRRITIQTNTPTQDASGEQVASWSTLATVWAKIDKSSAAERFINQQVVGEVDMVFQIRYRSDVTDKMRLVYGGQNYNIKGVTEVGRQRGTRIAARLVDA